MSKETEKKIQLKPSEIEEVLSKCELMFGFKVKPYLQQDEYFDREDGLFQKKDYTVRLRTDFLDNKNLYKIAVKGPRFYLKDKTYTRIDIEFAAGSLEDFYEDVRRKKLNAVVKLEKRRWKFKNSELKVTIDEYPFIGHYLEIESDDLELITKTVELLNLLQRKSVKKNSTELLETRLKKFGLPTRPNLVATFELESEFYNK